MKSLGCPKQPYVLWEAQSLELQLSTVERLMGFVLGGTALLPPCQNEWGGWSKPEPLCDGWRASGWMVMLICSPLGDMKIPRKSGNHQEQGPRMLLKFTLARCTQGPSSETAQPPASVCTLSAINSSSRAPGIAASLLLGK